jgi:hypothetical protein
MRCQACNVVLTPQESTRKFAISGDYVDLCNKCLSTIDDVDTLDSEYLDDEEGESDE